MKFNPKKHGLRSTTKFIRGTVVVETADFDLTPECLAKLGEDGGQTLVDQGFCVITDKETGEVLTEPSLQPEIPADQGGGTVDLGALAAEAAAFVDRNLDQITDEEIGRLSPEQRAAVRDAETNGKARASLLARLA